MGMARSVYEDVVKIRKLPDGRPDLFLRINDPEGDFQNIGISAQLIHRGNPICVRCQQGHLLLFLHHVIAGYLGYGSGLAYPGGTHEDHDSGAPLRFGDSVRPAEFQDHLLIDIGQDIIKGQIGLSPHVNFIHNLIGIFLIDLAVQHRIVQQLQEPLLFVDLFPLLRSLFLGLFFRIPFPVLLLQLPPFGFALLEPAYQQVLKVVKLPFDGFPVLCGSFPVPSRKPALSAA